MNVLDLTQQALDLHRCLSEAYWREDAKRNEYGRNIGDRATLARLDRLKRKAADRWRRRRALDVMPDRQLRAFTNTQVDII